MDRPGRRPFDILVREFEPGLRAFVLAAVHDAGAADDVVQETFLAAYCGLDQYDPNRLFGGWLRGIARNKIAEHFRSRATGERHVRILPPEAVEAVADQFDRLMPGRGDSPREALAALHDCLASLAPADYALICGAYLAGQTCRALAAEFGHTLEAIKKRLQRARAELRDCIEARLRKEGVEMP